MKVDFLRSLVEISSVIINIKADLISV